MEKNELLKTWADKCYADLYESETARTDEGIKKTLQEYLENVFNVGVETGIGEEKTRVQLAKHGQPYGFDH